MLDVAGPEQALVSRLSDWVSGLRTGLRTLMALGRRIFGGEHWTPSIQLRLDRLPGNSITLCSIQPTTTTPCSMPLLSLDMHTGQ